MKKWEVRGQKSEVIADFAAHPETPLLNSVGDWISHSVRLLGSVSDIGFLALSSVELVSGDYGH